MSLQGKKGKVYLIGAGPGDPGLMTVKGIEALKEADCVFYDYLVNPRILKYTSKNSELIKHTKGPMDKLLIKKAKEGKIVARLKSGDPFIFGRGSEEAQALAKAKVPFEIISGVTSAISVPAYAGIPLTNRKISSTCTFITGQEDPDKKESSIDWKNLAESKGTLVFLMGVKNLKTIANNLLRNGMDKKTKAAIITWGTLPSQKTVVTNLEYLGMSKVQPPSIIIVGGVVELRRKLNWFENKPLFGKRILVTRMEENSNRLSSLLEKEGAIPIEFPTIKIEPLENYSAFDSKINEIQDYDWLIFTSANGIEYALQRLNAIGLDIRQLKGPSICAIGPKTKEKIENLGLRVEYIPYEYCAEAVVKYFKNKKITNKNILILRAKEARNILPDGLRALGNSVDCIPVYETKTPSVKREISPFHCVTFTSSSCVKNFPKKTLKGETVAAIGPITSAACRKLGIKVDIEAKKYTLDGLIQAIKDYYAKSN